MAEKENSEVEEEHPAGKNRKKSEKAVNDVAQEVYEGKWGSGQEMRQKLSEAGYNQHEVMKKVTRLRNNLEL